MNKESISGKSEEVGLVVAVEVIKEVKNINNKEKIMKNNSDSKKNEADKSIKSKKAGVGVGKGDASKTDAAPVLTEQQIKELTENTVEQLNTQTDGECNARFERGRLIADYVKSVNPSGKKNQKHYEKLAAHPASILKVQQIRFYHYSFILKTELESSLTGTDTSSLKLSHWVAVMPRELNNKEKVRLLKATVKNNYSVAQLQNAVKQQIDGQRKEKGTVKTPDLDKVTERFVKQSQTLLASFSYLKDNAKESTDPAVSAQKIKINAEVKRIARFALDNGYLTVEELTKFQNETTQPTVNPVGSEKKEAA